MLCLAKCNRRFSAIPIRVGFQKMIDVRGPKATTINLKKKSGIHYMSPRLNIMIL